MSVQGVPPDLLFRFWPIYQQAFPLAQLLITEFPGEITSFYRNAVENRRVGGADFSQHRLGFAFDYVPADPVVFADAARFLGFTPVVEPDHVHVQFFRAGVVPRHLFPR